MGDKKKISKAASELGKQAKGCRKRITDADRAARIARLEHARKAKAEKSKRDQASKRTEAQGAGCDRGEDAEASTHGK